MFDYSLSNKRLIFRHSNDPYTTLTDGQQGSIKYSFDNAGIKTIVIRWDNGSNLALLEGIDQFEIYDYDDTKINSTVEEKIHWRIEKLKHTHPNLFDKENGFDSAFIYSILHSMLSIEGTSKEEIEFCFKRMKEEMAKHPEKYTLLDEMALGEDKE